MSSIDCGACDELRETSPEFVQNGVTKTICNSLKNDTGLNPSLTTTHTDCEDLDTANDCLVGRLEQEIEAYEVCDWKTYMHKFVGNLYELLKAMICAICGIWTNIHRHDCEIQHLYEGMSFRVGEIYDTTVTHIVPGLGVSCAERGAGMHESDVYLRYRGGSVCQGGGSLVFYSEDFTDVDGTAREGNPYWATNGEPVGGNELIYEIRLKNSEYPEVDRFYNGWGQEANVGCYHVSFNFFTEGQYAYGQHGSCNVETGEPLEPDRDYGHLVPDGWTYLQLRMGYKVSLILPGGNRRATSPRYYCCIKFKKAKIKC